MVVRAVRGAIHSGGGLPLRGEAVKEPPDRAQVLLQHGVSSLGNTLPQVPDEMVRKELVKLEDGVEESAVLGADGIHEPSRGSSDLKTLVGSSGGW